MLTGIGVNKIPMSNSAFSKNHLSIELGSGFCFLLLGNTETKVISETFRIDLAENNPDYSIIFNHSALLNKSFHSVSLSFCHQKFSLIPDSILEKSELRAFLELNCKLTADDEVQSKALHSLTASLVYAIDKKVLSRFQQNFPNLVVSHAVDHFLQQILLQEKEASELHLSIYPGIFLAAVRENGDLKFVNSFSFRSAEDVLYYSVYVAEQCKLKPELLHLFLSGEVKEGDNISQILVKYFYKVHLFGLNSTLLRNIQIIENKSFKNTQLINQFKCAL